MEFTTKWSLWGLRVNVILYYMVSLFANSYHMGQITPSLGSWTVGTGDLGRIPILALGFISWFIILSRSQASLGC
jgi:hypothetical protein